MNAENIAGLSAVWRDIQTTLTQVSACCNSYSDKEKANVTLINADFSALTKDLTSKRHTMDAGEREASIKWAGTTNVQQYWLVSRLSRPRSL